MQIKEVMPCETPRSINEEIICLEKLGVESYEINYIINLKFEKGDY